VFRLESWKLSGLLEEAGVGIVQVAKRHLEGLGVNFLEPRVFLFEFGKFVNEVNAGLLFAFCVSFDTLFEAPIVEEAGASEVLLESGSLVLGRKKFVPERLEHFVETSFLLQSFCELEEIPLTKVGKSDIVFWAQQDKPFDHRS
jgi:hypothetical protein